MTKTEQELMKRHEQWNRNHKVSGFLAAEIRSSHANWAPLMERLEDERACDIADAPKAHRKPAIICGSGPSLDQLMPILHRWRGDVLCATSQVSTLIYYGRPPSHVVVVDPLCSMDQIEAEVPQETALIAHPGVDESFARQWKGPIHLYRAWSMMREVQYLTDAQATAYSQVLPGTGTVRSYIRTLIENFGSVLPTLLRAAQMLGYSPIYLAGADFGFPYNQGRFTKWAHRDGQWYSEEARVAQFDADQPRAENGCPTTIQQLAYRENFMVGLRTWVVPNVINMSVDGALAGIFPEAYPHDVIQRDRQGYHQKKTVEVADRWLAAHQVYVVEFEGGTRAFKGSDPEKIVREASAALRRVGIAVDEAANMRRIRRAMQ